MLGTTATAQAQRAGYGPMIAENAPHDSISTLPMRAAAMPQVEAEPRIVINTPGSPNTPANIVDPVDINGIGQMFVAAPGGGVGTCTGSLINPRTVIFAAHCVNTVAQEAYGSNTGGTPIAFGFRNDNLAGVREYILATLNGQANANQFRTNTANFVYNAEEVRYHPDSLGLGPNLNFIEADVAIAALDTPTRDIPTWALLLSALPAPAAISNTTGTGYHVTITGYGSTGTGTTGANQAGNWRRRVAENYIGILGSFDDRDLFLFGSPSGLPQNLYQLDFDDPRRGTADAYPFDFNLFKDAALPREGTTGPGDSGGPLILDRTYAEQVVIGVLSGGSRFFGAQPFSAYGTSSFYQPLYLFWDWIAENNPYRYVGARAGNGNWEDAAHWTSLQDPAYRVLNAAGQLVTGIPDMPGAGVAGADPNQFGQICFQLPGTDECFDLATNQLLVNGQPVPTSAGTTASATNAAGAGGRAAGLTAETIAHNGAATLSDIVTADTPQALADATAVLPAPTIANGLPGASSFVPNNVAAAPRQGVSARYYDVTLANTGITTLSSAATIDRLTVAGSGARLNIAAGGNLTSLIDVTQTNGMMQVDGVLSTPGDYLLMRGGLTGTGRINTPFFTSMMGMIAPGTAGTTGTLTFAGNITLASASSLLIDLGPNGLSDRVVVTGTAESLGVADVGGRVGFAPTAGTRLRDGDSYTILTAAGGVVGTFATPGAISAILTPTLSYSANAVNMRIVAGRYADVVDRNSAIQTSYARLLDQNRSNTAALAGLYGEFDLQDQGTIRAQLENLAPRTAPLQSQLGTVATDAVSRFFRDRVNNIADGGQGGTLAVYGKPMQLASVAAVGMNMAGPIDSDVGSGAVVQQGALPDNLAVYLAGGYIDGNGVGLPSVQRFGRNQFDGFFIAAGVEHLMDEASTIGFAFTYSDLNGSTVAAGDSSGSQLIQGTLYSSSRYGALLVDTQTSAGVLKIDSSRQAAIGANNFTLTSDERAFTFSNETGVALVAETTGATVKPRASLRYSHIGFTNVAEQGGGPAMRYNLGNFDSLQGRAGASANATLGSVQPFVSANYVHEFRDAPGAFGANFVNGIGNAAVFSLPTTDRDWAEISGGFTFGSERVSATIAAERTIERDDIRNATLRGSVAIRF
ncbi:autotransporter outer membrane beta-barrel domain-containing protein [Sphingomonas sp. 37zxx]|uniref:autotransporter outer membrane beta-barrel domain-containing protein n=1 Tax=Sphingomonas sp. 37zxx TaxID=1550073 RepID=UPI001E5637FF|nr:autotransporter outer membrane beta-barrel domain-containing protein [Sphingomonas sp. 37zxx]